MEFDFDVWRKLAEEDPEGFDAKKAEFMEKFIMEDLAPDDPDRQQRARALLWRMEQNYRHIKNPQERFNMIIAEFWKQVNKFQEALEQFK